MSAPPAEQENYAVIGLYNPELADLVTSNSEAVTLQVSGEHWMKQFGLAANKLDAQSILRRMGFKHAKGFDSVLRKDVQSIYGDNLFCRLSQGGEEYNVIARKQELQQTLSSLQKLAELFQKRLEWLTHGSRRMFGLILERRVTVVVDYQILSVLEFEQFCLAFERLIKEQLAHVDTFNVIRCDEQPLNCFAEQCVAASAENVDSAVQWLRNWRRVAVVNDSVRGASNFSVTNLLEGLMRAAKDRAEAVYLVTNGVTVDCCKELLRDHVRTSRPAVHIAAFNCSNTATDCLGQMCREAGSRFHAYRVTTHFTLYEPAPDSHNAAVATREYFSGSLASSADKQMSSTRADVLSVFSEIETAKCLCQQVSYVSTLVSFTSSSLVMQAVAISPPILFPNFFLKV